MTYRSPDNRYSETDNSMHARARTRALTALVALTLGASLATITPAYAAEADPQPPVVVDDTVTMWPGQIRMVDVLANDTDPDGDASDLALCRFPEPDFTVGEFPEVLIMPTGESAGSLMVLADPRAQGTHTFDYWVCDYDFLIPATLTVVIRDVAPVDVAKVPGQPGKLTVTNENEQPIHFWYGHPRAPRPDAKVLVPAHETVTVTVQRKRIVWIGVIGRRGIADFGYVNHIKLDGDPLPPPHGHIGSLRAGSDAFVKRWLA
jgi:Bacterial Ig domain